MPDSAVDSDFEDGEARMTLSNLAMPDYFNIPNALFHGTPPDPGVVSLDIKWAGVTKRGSFTNPGQRFEMDFKQTGAHISWSGTNKKTGARFHTTRGAQKVQFAQIAKQRSGVFFGTGEDDD